MSETNNYTHQPSSVLWEEEILRKDIDIVKVFWATPQYWMEVLEQYFDPLYKKFTTILVWLQKYAYVQDSWDSSQIPYWAKKLSTEDVKAQFWLTSWNFISYLSGISPFSSKAITKHVQQLIDTTKQSSKYIIPESAWDEIAAITNQLIATWESLDILLRHYYKLYVRVTQQEVWNNFWIYWEPWVYCGNKIPKKPSLESYDKKRDIYINWDGATLPIHFHTSDDMIDIVNYRADHDE